MYFRPQPECVRVFFFSTSLLITEGSVQYEWEGSYVLPIRGEEVAPVVEQSCAVWAPSSKHHVPCGDRASAYRASPRDCWAKLYARSITGSIASPVGQRSRGGGGGGHGNNVL